MRVGLIARCDKTGLGNQTRNLARMLRPDEILLIDSTPFNGNEQFKEIYATYSVTESYGFPSEVEIIKWLQGVDVVITCEIFYNRNFVDLAKKAGVKTINHFNWEFADYLREPTLTLPDVMASPSAWHFEEAQRLWGNVQYLPTPVFVDDYQMVREVNKKRTGKKRFLHIAGRPAVNDRNGTQDLMLAMRYSSEDYEMVIKTQSDGIFNKYNDPRITIDRSAPENEAELYYDFDAMILPRRYGGQCLPMAEALCAGLPVIMPRISPNESVLPSHWLVNAVHSGKFMTRTQIDLHTVLHQPLGMRLDFLSLKDLQMDKVDAYNRGYREYSNYELESKWEKLIENLGSR